MWSTRRRSLVSPAGSRACGVPTVAAISGYCVGGGLAIAGGLRPAHRDPVGAVRCADRPHPRQLPVDEQHAVLIHQVGPSLAARPAAAGPAAHRRGGARLGLRGRVCDQDDLDGGDAPASADPARPRADLDVGGQGGRTPVPRATIPDGRRHRVAGLRQRGLPARVAAFITKEEVAWRAGDRRRGAAAGGHGGRRPLPGARRPHAAMMLGDMGARVIKVESPGTGDDARGWGPPFVGPEDDPQSTYFLSANRNKESVRLDLKSEEDRATLGGPAAPGRRAGRELPPGVLDRLGFPPGRLPEANPRLVVLSITGFGHDGPEGGRAGYDQIAQGESGLMSLTGPDPAPPPRSGCRSATCSPGSTARSAWRRPRRARPHRPGHRRPDLAARRARRRPCLPGHPPHRRGRGPQAQGNHHPAIAPYGAPGRRRDAPGRRRQRRAVAVAAARAGRRSDTAASRPTRPPRAPRGADQGDRGRLVTATADTWLARLAEAGVPAGGSAPSTRCTPGTRPSPGPAGGGGPPHRGRIGLPGPPLRLFDPRGDGRARPAPATAAARRARRRGPGLAREKRDRGSGGAPTAHAGAGSRGLALPTPTLPVAASRHDLSTLLALPGRAAAGGVARARRGPAPEARSRPSTRTPRSGPPG